MNTVKMVIFLGLLAFLFGLQAGKIDQLPDDFSLIKESHSGLDILSIYDHKNDKEVASAFYNVHFANLDTLFVQPEYRNQGYGSLLFKAVCKNLAQEGHYTMTWTSLSPNLKNQNKLNKFYENLGGIINKQDDDGAQDMQIDLTPYRTPTS